MTKDRRSSAPSFPNSRCWLNSLIVAALVLAAAFTWLCPGALSAAEKQDKTTGKGGATATGPAAWTQSGQASFYYGSRWHGGPTASGERYDQNSMTAAHKTLPMNTLVEVTRADTGAKVIVRINNRGPYARGRVIDLSKEAARRLNMIDRGVAAVSLRILPGKNTAALEEAMAVRDAEIIQEKNDFALTLASFEKKDDAKRFRERMQAVQVDNAIVRRVKLDEGVRYRVEIGGFDSEATAREQRLAISDRVLAK